MTLYSKYPTINYPFTINNKEVVKNVVDITTNVRVDPDTINNVVEFNYMNVTDGETPEMTSYRQYDTVDNYHLLILANDNYDWRNDRILTPLELESYINEKYVNPYGIHHFEDVNGNEIDNIYKDDDGEDAYAYPKNVIPITNWEYETRINESKRSVKIIKEEYIERLNNIVDVKLDGEVLQ